MTKFATLTAAAILIASSSAAFAQTATSAFDVRGYISGSTTASSPSIVAPATTYNYYVAPTGSDTASGSKAAPFKTLARAIKALRPSTTVWVAPGTYLGGF